MFGDAEAYERFMGRWSRPVASSFVAFSAVPDHGRMLDAGSGTGVLAFTIAERKRNARVLGIDPSREYVAYSIHKNPFPDRADFEEGDAQQLRYPDGSFDAALSLLVFNFIPDPKKAISELRRVTKRGATISAAVWDYGNGMRMLRAFWDAAVHLDPAADKLDERHMPLCRTGELSALWQSAGLKDVHEQAIDIGMKFESFADYWEPFLLGQGPAGAYVGRLNDEKRLALRNEIRHRLSLAAENTPFSLSARAWAVRGVT